MSGKGETVEFTREVKQGHPVSKAEKDALKAKIIALIDLAAKDITVEVMLKK